MTEQFRLTTIELRSIIAAANAVFGTTLNTIRLFGSRIDPNQTGGDIDLLFEVNTVSIDKFSSTQKLRLELCSRLGEQKFDLVIICKDSNGNSLRENNFYQLILPTSKVLWTHHGSSDD